MALCTAALYAYAPNCQSAKGLAKAIWVPWDTVVKVARGGGGAGRELPRCTVGVRVRPREAMLAVKLAVPTAPTTAPAPNSTLFVVCSVRELGGATMV